MAALTREQQIQALEAAQIAQQQRLPSFLENLGTSFADYGRQFSTPSSPMTPSDMSAINAFGGGAHPFLPPEPPAPELYSQRRAFMQEYGQAMPRDVYKTAQAISTGPTGSDVFANAFLNQPTDLGMTIKGGMPSRGQSITNLSRESAQNRNQQAADAAKQQQADYQSALKAAQGVVSGAQERVSAMEGLKGFKPEEGRKYNVEKDAAGNIIAVNALQTAGEKKLGGMAPGVLESKSWKAEGSEGGVGHPFTPNLDKFKARQTPEAMMHSWDAKKPESAEEAAMVMKRREAAGLTAGQTPEQIAKNRAILQGLSENRRHGVGRVIGADVASGGGSDVTMTHYKPTSITSDHKEVAQNAISQNLALNPEQGNSMQTGWNKQLQQSFSGQASPAFEKKWNNALQKDIADTKKKNRGGDV